VNWLEMSALAQNLRRIAEECAIAVATHRVNSFVNKRPTIDEALDFAYSFRFAGFGIAPTQVRAEISELLRWLATSEAPRRILEIGTSMGGTLFLLATSAADDARLLSIDLPQGQFGGSYNPRKDRLYRGFARRGQQIELLLGDSHEDSTRERVGQWLGGEPLDLLFIDGDHTRDGVLSDLRLYSQLVRQGGSVVLHDIVPGPPEMVGGVPDVWQKLPSSAKSTIVKSWQQGGYGLGILRKQVEPSQNNPSSSPEISGGKA
jgi:predicted O-methyltransferase YrrM